jgi:hypothetical protein
MPINYKLNLMKINEVEQINFPQPGMGCFYEGIHFRINGGKCGI